MPLSPVEVLAALDEGDEGVRQAAIARLDLGDSGALALLLRAMADPSWRVRREAVERASSGGLPVGKVVESLVPAMAEPDDVGLRNAAIEAIVLIGVPAVAAVQQALESRPAHRKVLCDVLGRIGSPVSARALSALLDDEDPNVCVAASEALGRLGRAGASGEGLSSDEEVGRRLLEALASILAAERGPSSSFRAAALLDAVARRGVALPVATLRSLVEDRVLGTAVLRAVAAGAAPAESEARALARSIAVAHLADGNCAKREAAILATAALADQERLALDAAARAATTEALLEGTVEVQRAAARVLGSSGDALVARPLLVALADPSLEQAATEALGILARKDPAALAGVAASLEAPGRTAVYRALVRVGDGATGLQGLQTQVARDLTVEDEGLAIAALELAGALGDGGLAPALAEVLLDAEAQGADGNDRAVAARQALAKLAVRDAEAVKRTVRGRSEAPFVALRGEIGGPDDVQPLAELLRDADVDVRRAAAAGLAALGARRVEMSEELAIRAAEAARMALVDESPGVRAAAAVALARLDVGRPKGANGKSTGAVEALLLATRDEDVRVRGASTRSLVELLQAARIRKDLPRTTAIKTGLRGLADGRDLLTAVPALEALLASSDPADSREDEVRLLDALTSAEEERRKVALHALAARPQLLVRGDLLRLVERALHDARWDLRRAAIAALVAVGGIGRAALVARRSIETDPIVRADLDRALAAIDGGAP